MISFATELGSMCYPHHLAPARDALPLPSERLVKRN